MNFVNMIGKRVERCNEYRNEVLRFDGKLSRFLRLLMKKPTCYVDRLRQNRTLRGMTILILWMAMLISIPQVDLNAAYASSQVQKILPPDSIPVTSPSNHLRLSTEYGEFSVLVLNAADLEKYLHTYTILDQCSSDHARALSSVLLYTQTTSSFL
jgi:hypothetical protein